MNRKVKTVCFLGGLFGLAVIWPFRGIVWAAPNCNFTIGTSVSTADGKGNFANVRPGDTVCISAGNRSGLRLVDFRGAPGAPITFINSGGKVNINDNNIGLELYGSQYVHITGSGDSNNFYGIEIMNSQNSGFNTNRVGSDGLQDGTEYIEVDHLFIHDVGAGIRSAKNNDLLNSGVSWIGHQFYYHDIYIKNTANEGMYLGSSTTGGEFPIHDVQVYNNRVENMAYDAIQVRQGNTRVLVHHNLVKDVGMAPCKNGNTDNSAGFNIAKGTNIGDWYSNTIIGARKGAYIKDVNNVRFFNNVLIDSGHTAPACTGTTPPEGAIELINVGNVLVANNTVINTAVSGAYGISVEAGSMVRDNIIAGTFASMIKGTGASLQGNLTSSNPTFFQFADYLNNDLHLTSASPAVGAASVSTLPINDFDGVSRPQGTKSDVGAFEFVSSGGVLGSGDANNDGSVNALDLKAILSGYLKSVTSFLNQYGVDSKINSFDFEVVLKRLP